MCVPIRDEQRCEDCDGPFWRWAAMFWKGWWTCGNCGAVNVPEDETEATAEPPRGPSASRSPPPKKGGGR